MQLRHFHLLPLLLDLLRFLQMCCAPAIAATPFPVFEGAALRWLVRGSAEGCKEKNRQQQFCTQNLANSGRDGVYCGGRRVKAEQSLSVTTSPAPPRQGRKVDSMMQLHIPSSWSPPWCATRGGFKGAKCLRRWLASVTKGNLVEEGSLCLLPHTHLPQIDLAFFWIVAKSHIPFSIYFKRLLLASPQHHLALGKEMRWESSTKWGLAPPLPFGALSGICASLWEQGEWWRKPTQEQGFTWTSHSLFLLAKFLSFGLW